jgi:methylmalonyl-CoA mutase N-terminal domain/subunit
VGVNKYTEGVDMEVELHEHNESWAQEQIARLKELKRTRDNKAAKETLKALEKAASEKKNVMPYLVACCKAYATVGEMANVFRQVFGEHKEPSIF